jgi:hypothetical protein
VWFKSKLVWVAPAGIVTLAGTVADEWLVDSCQTEFWASALSMVIVPTTLLEDPPTHSGELRAISAVAEARTGTIAKRMQSSRLRIFLDLYRFAK